MLDGLMQGADRDVVKIWQKMNAPRFDNIMLKTKTVSARALPEGMEAAFAAMEEGEAGGNASVAAPAPQVCDLVLQAVGRTPNGKKIAADKAGVAVTDRGFINVDIQMRSNVSHIFAIGDIVGQPMLAHKAVHEAHVAAEVIAGELQGNKELADAAFIAHVISSVAYTDPEVAWVGLTEDSGLVRRASRSKRVCSRGTLLVAPLPTGGMKASPNCCLTTRRKLTATARFWAAAWLVRMGVT
jgi:dihydrolipoamide dehydrogenase